MPRPPNKDVVQYLKDELAAERLRYEALLKEVLALKRDGFTATVQYDAPSPAPPLPGPVTKAISLRSEPGTAERRELERRAYDLVRGEMETDDVVQAILNGEEVDL